MFSFRRLAEQPLLNTRILTFFMMVRAEFSGSQWQGRVGSQHSKEAKCCCSFYPSLSVTALPHWVACLPKPASEIGMCKNYIIVEFGHPDPKCTIFQWSSSDLCLPNHICMLSPLFIVDLGPFTFYSIFYFASHLSMLFHLSLPSFLWGRALRLVIIIRPYYVALLEFCPLRTPQILAAHTEVSWNGLGHRRSKEECSD